MKKIDNKKKNDGLFWFGLLFGFGGGFIGNLLVTSTYTLITGNCKNNICYIGSWALSITSFILFVFIVISLYKIINKILIK